MAQTFSPTQLKITAPPEGFQTGGWYQGRQYWNGTLSEPGVIHPSSNQPGAGTLVSPQVNLQSDVAQGNQPGDIEKYLEEQRRLSAGVQGQPVTPTAQPTGQPTAGAGTGTGVGTGSLVGTGQTTFNLPDLYKNLYEEAGINTQEDLLVTREGQYLDAKSKISDNPFLSASQIDQRLQRLERAYDKETAPIRSKIAMQKADIEIKLNLQMKQFDIQSQQAKDALNLAQSLLEIGALDKASGEDIAELTRKTGIPSSMFLSAIEARKKKDVETKIIESEADDGTVTVSVINTQTGEVISQTSLGKIGNKQTGGTVTERREADLEQTRQNLIGDIQRGATLRDLVTHYGSAIDVAEIYRLYNSAPSPYGEAKETLDEVKEGKFTG